MLRRQDHQPSASALEDACDPEIAHIHICVVEEIIRFLVVALRTPFDFAAIKLPLRRSMLTALPEVKNAIHNGREIVLRCCRLCPEGKLNAADLGRTRASLELQHNCQHPTQWCEITSLRQDLLCHAHRTEEALLHRWIGVCHEERTSKRRNGVECTKRGLFLLHLFQLGVNQSVLREHQPPLSCMTAGGILASFIVNDAAFIEEIHETDFVVPSAKIPHK